MALHGAFEMRAAFDGDRLVDDVALDTRGRGQADLESANTANNTPVNHDIIGNTFALDGCGFANRQKVCMNVTFDLTFDLDIA